MGPQLELLAWAIVVFGAAAAIYRLLVSALRADPTLAAAALYLVLMTISQYAASKVTVYLWFGVPAGTATCVATVAMLDIVVMREGFRYARNLVMIGLASQALITVANASVLSMPAISAPEGVYAYVFGVSARIALASAAAYLAAELTDAYLVYRIRHAIWKRVLYSDPVAMAVDTMIFVPLAFYGVLPGSVLESTMLGLLLAKWSLSPAVLGLVYANRRFLLRDVYEAYPRPDRPGPRRAAQ
ncbi:MAG: queuosine precursor transporter [Conexivisphaera sp.]